MSASSAATIDLTRDTIDLTEETTETSSTPMSAVRLRVLSYNLWFEPVQMKARLDAFVRLVRELQVDVVMCQEVTPQMEQYIKPRLEAHKHSILIPLDPRRPYGEAMFLNQSSEWKVCNEFNRINFDTSQMGRQLQVAELKHQLVANAHVLVANTHLESLKENKAERLSQLSLSLQSLQKHALPFIFGGDTNLTSGDEKSIRLPPNVRDAWVAAGSPANQQYTWDTTINKNLDVKFPARCRFDRYYYTGKTIQLASFTTVGKQPIPYIEPTLYCSDHWGILAEFQVNC